MQKSLSVKKGVTLVADGTKTIMHVPSNMKGKTLKNLVAQNKQSFDIARQVLTTVK